MITRTRIAVVLTGALLIALVLRQAGLVSLPFVGSPERPPGPLIAGARGRIAAVRDGDLWTVDLRSGVERQLTQTGGVTAPRLSGSGTWIAFEREGQLWIIRTDGKGASAVPGADQPQSATWAPRASRLAFASRDGSLSTLDPAAGDKGRRVIVPVGSGVGSTLVWSSEGNRLAYERHQRVSGQVSNEAIWTITAAGSDALPVYVASGDFSLSLCCWTYRSGFVLFWQGGNANSSTLAAPDGLPLFLARATSSQPISVADAVLLHRFWQDAAPRSDGMALVTGGGRNATENKQLVVAEPRAVAGNRIVVDVLSLETGGAPASPAWAPVNSTGPATLAYSAGTSLLASGGDLAASLAGRRIWLTPADGKDKRLLLADATVPAGVSDDRPMWARDGKTLIFVRRLSPETSVRGGGQRDGAELWVSSAEGGTARRVTGGLPDPGLGAGGVIDWAQVFDYYPG